MGRPQAETLISSLSAITLRPGWPVCGRGGAVDPPLVGARHSATGDDIDRELIASLAGDRPAGEVGAPPLLWEERRYRLDFATPEARRLTAVLHKLAAEPIGRALAVETIAAQLNAPTVTLADMQASTVDLTQWATTLGPLKRPPNGLDPLQMRRQLVARALRDVNKPGNGHVVKQAARAAEPLFHLVDDLLAEALLAFTYALDLGDPAGTALTAGNISHRHDFGAGEKVQEFRERAAWAEPIQRVEPGVPWHVSGSLLGLDLALSELGMRRMSTDALPGAPTLRPTERATFSKTVALLNPLELRDADRDAIVDGIARGRQRVLRLPADGEGFDSMAEEILMDGWRRRGLRWTLMNEPNGPFFLLDDGSAASRRPDPERGARHLGHGRRRPGWLHLHTAAAARTLEPAGGTEVERSAGLRCRRPELTGRARVA